MKNITLVLALFLFLTPNLFAKSIVGVVTDAESGDFIEGVIVSSEIKGEPFKIKTNNKGNFVINYKGKANFELTFNHQNYIQKTITVSNPNNLVEVKLTLKTKKIK